MKHPDQESLSQLMDGEWQGLDVRRCVLDACRDETLRVKWSRYHLARDAMRREPIAGATLSLARRISAALEHEPAYSNVTAIGGAIPAPAVADAAAPVETSPVAREGAAIPPASDAGTSDPLPASGEGRRGGAWRTVAAGFGLAASVALVTVVGLDAWQGRAGGEGPGGDAVRLADAGASGARDAAPADPEAPAALPVAAGDAFSRQDPRAPLPEVEFVANTGAYWVAPGSSVRRAGSEQRLNMFLSQHIEHSPTAERQGMLPYSRLVGYDERAPER